MKPTYEKLLRSPDEGFVVKEIRGQACNCPWQCHPEVEIVLVLQSHGYRIVGDSIRPLQRGDLVLLGPNLPHAYQHTDPLTAGRQPAHCILVQFDQSFLTSLLQLPAAAGVRRLLHRAQLGLHIAGPTRAKVATLLAEMMKRRGMRRISLFLELLDQLAQSRRASTIASPGFATPLPADQQERISRVCQYIDENCRRPLSLGDVARLIHMSEGAFSRFFRMHLGRTFPAFVNDLRIGRACRLLAETEMNITEIALACGYHNLSNFNRQFLRLKKVAPSAFRQQMQRHA